METTFPLPVTAAKVGTYFIGKYYPVLLNRPNFVHQFYLEASTLLRLDGNTIETASSVLQIHQILTSLNYRGIEIKSAHSLESWNGGVLVMVSGDVREIPFKFERRFLQTFFLAPQEKGYYVLNDIFRYIDDEQILRHPFSERNFDSKLNASSATAQEQVSNYIFGGEIQDGGFAGPANTVKHGPVKNYNFAEEQLHQVPETEKILEDKFSVQSKGSLQGAMNSVPAHSPAIIQEPVIEPPNRTYASVVAKGQPSPAMPSQSSVIKHTPSQWLHEPESLSQPSVAAASTIEMSGMKSVEEASATEVEIKSVFVGNVPAMMAASEIAEEFRKFGKLGPDGVAIKTPTRKDIDVCYAFVEFEDISGVQNAIQAHTVQIGGHRLYIKGRLSSRSNPTHGGRGIGRGRVSYPMEDSRRQFGGRGFGNDRDFNRARGNGFPGKAP